MEAGCGDATRNDLWDMGYEMVPVLELKISVVGYPLQFSWPLCKCATGKANARVQNRDQD
jgi:hypothetical protein